jgi:hypothetical protein
LTTARGLAEDWARAGVATTASAAMAVKSLFMSLLLVVLMLEALLGFDFIRGVEEGFSATPKQLGSSATI